MVTTIIDINYKLMLKYLYLIPKYFYLGYEFRKICLIVSIPTLIVKAVPMMPILFRWY